MRQSEIESTKKMFWREDKSGDAAALCTGNESVCCPEQVCQLYEIRGYWYLRLFRLFDEDRTVYLKDSFLISISEAERMAIRIIQEECEKRIAEAFAIKNRLPDIE